MSPTRFEASGALLFLCTCGSQCHRASAAQFSADVALRGGRQTNAQLGRTDAAGTLARAHTRTQVEACACAFLLSAFILLG